MLPIPIFLLIVISLFAGYLGKVIIDKMTLEQKIISLWKNGYSSRYVANKLDISVEQVEEVINRIIYHN